MAVSPGISAGFTHLSASVDSAISPDGVLALLWCVVLQLVAPGTGEHIEHNYAKFQKIGSDNLRSRLSDRLNPSARVLTSWLQSIRTSQTIGYCSFQSSAQGLLISPSPALLLDSLVGGPRFDLVMDVRHWLGSDFWGAGGLKLSFSRRLGSAIDYEPAVLALLKDISGDRNAVAPVVDRVRGGGETGLIRLL